ncbi:MAG TPA: hypothetical protein PLE32_12165, partial [Haliscomenobacter sp.]|nr:hypothetical protein [Haliscomenobacter sp.]
ESLDDLSAAISLEFFNNPIQSQLSPIQEAPLPETSPCKPTSPSKHSNDHQNTHSDTHFDRQQFLYLAGSNSSKLS